MPELHGGPHGLKQFPGPKPGQHLVPAFVFDLATLLRREFNQYGVRETLTDDVVAAAISS